MNEAFKQILSIQSINIGWIQNDLKFISYSILVLESKCG